MKSITLTQSQIELLQELLLDREEVIQEEIDSYEDGEELTQADIDELNRIIRLCGGKGKMKLSTRREDEAALQSAKARMAICRNLLDILSQA